MPKITASQGDSITSLAHDNGHFWQKVWDHGENAALKSKRKNPNQIMEGDDVFIPDLEVKQESRAADARHVFKRKGVPAKMKMQLFMLGEPRKNEPYVLELDGKLITGNLDGDGKLEQFIPPNCKGGTLKLKSGKEIIPIKLGFLNPIDEVSGVKQRLNNLGFRCGGEDNEMSDQTKAALREFQAKHKLPDSGDLDAATKSKLQSLHP